MAWRDSLRPASFRGVTFHVEATSKAGGRRGVTYEFPFRDAPADEDLGRRARRFSVSGYVLGEDYHLQASALEGALNAGTGQLVLPTGGTHRARCETYNRTERRQEGGFCAFDMGFVEAPISAATSTTDTAAAVKDAAGTAEKATAESADKAATSDTEQSLPDMGVWT